MLFEIVESLIIFLVIVWSTPWKIKHWSHDEDKNGTHMHLVWCPFQNRYPKSSGQDIRRGHVHPSMCPTLQCMTWVSNIDSFKPDGPQMCQNEVKVFGLPTTMTDYKISFSWNWLCSQWFSYCWGLHMVACHNGGASLSLSPNKGKRFYLDLIQNTYDI